MQRSLVLLYVFLSLTTRAFAQTTSDYLILQDIGSYKVDRPENVLQGRQPTGGPEIVDTSTGIFGPADHYSADHVDTSYTVAYIGGNGMPSPTVIITLHAGSDSDQWLLHEVDRDFRNSYGIPGRSYGSRQINGQMIIENLTGGGCYRWLSGKKVVQIEYRDPQMRKAEPLEIVKAYLIKYPSTLPEMVMSQLSSEENVGKWIKDEMERRLWLGEKWLAQIQPSTQLGSKLKSATDSMVVYLNYCEKYFGIHAKDEKIALASALDRNNVAAVRAKLTSYKTWWASHKGDVVTL